MFGSVGAAIPKVQSKQVLRSTTESSRPIKLEVLDAAAVKGPRRSSFLPENWDDVPKTQLSENRKTSRYSYQGVSTISIRLPEKRRRAKKYCTGSAYYGQFNQLGMAGRGVYKFPHGVIYDGFFNSKGEFHGTGILVYPGGQRLEGLWKNGKLVQGGATLISHDNSPNSRYYCKMPDRRFQIEVDNDLRPAGEEFLTNSTVPRPIPPGMYDTGMGFYDPVRRVIIDYYDSNVEKTVFDAFPEDSRYVFSVVLQKTVSQHELEQVMRHQPAAFRHTKIDCIPTEEREDWIINNCRKGWDEPVGYRTDFYEIWTPGYKKQNQDIDDGVHDNEMDDLIERLARMAEQKTSNVYSFIQSTTTDKIAGGSRRGTPRIIPPTPDGYSSRWRKSRRKKGAPSPRVTSYGLKPFMFLFTDSKPETTHVRIKEDEVEVI